MPLIFATRKLIFSTFRSFATWKAQSNNIISTVTAFKPKRKLKLDSIINNSRSYHLNQKKVCKSVYLQTLGISNRSIDYCLNKKCFNGICTPDRRGCNTPNKTTLTVIKRIRDFLDLIPKIKNAYLESNNACFPDITYNTLYDLYKEREENANQQLACRPIFIQHFRIYNCGINVHQFDACNSTAAKLKYIYILKLKTFDITMYTYMS